MSKAHTATDVADRLKLLIGRFTRHTALVFASGPSLTKLWSDERPIPLPSIAVNDAWRIVPSADVLYATDAKWWMHHKGVPKFSGVKVGYEGPGPAGVVWLQGSGRTGYDERLGYVRHQWNSGGAAIHLAAQLGAKRIVLVGFDMRPIKGRDHFFGAHPEEIQGRTTSRYDIWIDNLGELAKELRQRKVEVLNATPESALKCWPSVDLEGICGGHSVSFSQPSITAETLLKQG